MFRGSPPLFVAAVITACVLFIPATARTAPQATQTITLRPGWNAVFLEVQPEPNDPASVFSGVPVESVWAWMPRSSTIEYIQNPSEGLWNQPGWAAYFKDPQQSFLTNLYGIRVNTAYLIKLGGSSQAVWNVTGRPSMKARRWKTDSFNLTGFHVDGSGPSCASILSPSKAHKNQAVYKLDANGAWRFVDAPSSEQVMAGESYWVYCDGASEYEGPFSVDLNGDDGLDFGDNENQKTVRIINHASHAKVVTVSLAGSASPAVLSYKDIDPATGELRWPVLSSVQLSVEAGKQVVLHLAVRRELMGSSTGESVMAVSDGEGTRYLIPVNAQNAGL